MAVKVKLKLPGGISSGKPAPFAITAFISLCDKAMWPCYFCATGKTASVILLLLIFKRFCVSSNKLRQILSTVGQSLPFFELLLPTKMKL
jgi:hypothetical protein